VALYFIYETGEHGGELVYTYAGGVGTRSGDPADLSNALVAALYHKARLDRDSGRAEDAARRTDELARLRPDDPTVRFLVVESKLRDRNDPQGALAELRMMQVAPDDPRLAPRRALLTSQAYVAAGQPDSAKAVLAEAARQFPNNRAVQDALAKLP
jgi:predicted Zn-dependent protease